MPGSTRHLGHTSVDPARTGLVAIILQLQPSAFSKAPFPLRFLAVVLFQGTKTFAALGFILALRLSAHQRVGMDGAQLLLQDTKRQDYLLW